MPEAAIETLKLDMPKDGLKILQHIDARLCHLARLEAEMAAVKVALEEEIQALREVMPGWHLELKECPECKGTGQLLDDPGDPLATKPCPKCRPK